MTGTIHINEVVLRDGLQNEARFVPTDRKVELADRLSRTGIRRLEVTSFVSPKSIPNLRDAEEVFRRIARNPRVIYTALVPNERGCERALLCDVDEINLVMSIGEAHNLQNMRMTCDQSCAQFENIVQITKDSRVRINGTVATAFGCPFEGPQPISRVLWAIDRYRTMAFDSITLADTIGAANPVQVSRVLEAVRKEHSDIEITMHFHNTRGMGLANVMAAVEQGITSFDAALGGIGGCPFAPGASGNICTEDLAHMLEQSGLETAASSKSLVDVANDLAKILERDLPGYVLKAGPGDRTYPLP